MPQEWTCTQVDASTTQCVVTMATTTGGTGYNGPNFQEWLFVGMVIIFFISLPSWRIIFRSIKKTFDGN